MARHMQNFKIHALQAHFTNRRKRFYPCRSRCNSIRQIYHKLSLLAILLNEVELLKLGSSVHSKIDSGPSFRTSWKEELQKLGVNVLHSSAYNPQSMGLVERLLQTLKELLRKTQICCNFNEPS